MTLPRQAPYLHSPQMHFPEVQATPQLPQLRESRHVSAIVTSPEVPQGSSVPLTASVCSRQMLIDGLPLPTQRAARSLQTKKLASQPSVHAE
jgi:hypothetical protein